jgi:hypothetical protein
LSHGIVTAPELNAVADKYVGQCRYFIDWYYPESEKYEFVYKLVADCLVPCEQFVPMHDVESIEAHNARTTATLRYFFFIIVIYLC